MPRSHVNSQRLLEFLKQICEIPAPTFFEEQRGQFIAELWQRMGLSPVIDTVGNVLATLEGSGPKVLLAAHLDTVFAADVDVTIKEKADRWYAPGIGDNSASLAVLSYYLETVIAEHLPLLRLTVAATVGEEGLGDLRGIREVLKHQTFDMVIALDGHVGTVVHQGVGSKRFEVTFKARGGHSWGDYPSPSAIHVLAEAVHSLNKMVIPQEPRSSFNIGQIKGGTSVNAIAEEAWFNLDLRSLDEQVLQSLEQDALRRIQRSVREHQVEVSVIPVGDRPAGVCPNAHLVETAKRVLHHLSIPVKVTASSTDANAAMSLGIPAIAFGVYRGGDAHRLSEWLEPKSLATGFLALESLMASIQKGLEARDQ
jgi:acetylornithine deacetylase/succinyl-diaminopimelate desuccinylase-like protein